MLIGKNLDVHLHGLVNRQSSFLSDFISQNLRIHNLKEEVCNQTVDMSCICANVCKTKLITCAVSHFMLYLILYSNEIASYH